MMEYILSVDYNLFYFINIKWSNSFFDTVMPYLRNKYFWAPLYLFIVSYLLVNHKREGGYLVVFLVLTVLVGDQISSALLKPLFGRLRPCNTENIVEYINVLVRCGGGKSFPSSHATNHFAVATLLIGTIKYMKFSIRYLLIFWALSISYAQVYVGVHFPLDIIFGGILGSSVGIVMSSLFAKYIQL